MIVPDNYYTPASHELRAIGAVQTLARWRHEGVGPPYMKIGARVVYRGADILAWLEAKRICPEPEPREVR